MVASVMPPPGWEKCPRCWAYVSKERVQTHDCPPLMVALVANYERKKNTVDGETNDQS